MRYIDQLFILSLDLLIRTQVLVLLVLLPHLLSFVSTWCPMIFGVWAGLQTLSVIDTRYAVTCAQCIRIYGTYTFQMGTKIFVMEVG